MRKSSKLISVISAISILGTSVFTFSGCNTEEDNVVTLRVSNWEEYIDLGDWDDDELIDIDNPYIDGSEGIFGENSMVDDFVEWFNSTHDYEVKVEYSTFGTNEDLYNRLSLGDVYDLVCPSDYLIMKLIAEDKVLPFSESFMDTTNEENYYVNGVSPYIDEVYENYEWNGLAACYMWGTTGLVYNPEIVEDVADVATWNIFLNKDYNRQITIKDNVRDAYFPALGIYNSDKLIAGVDQETRSALLNDTSSESIAAAQDILKRIKDNVYSFETDSGKADMVTGKVAANYQWSGDSVYIMDQADEDEIELWFSVPDECTNLWFDGWVMLKDGIGKDEKKQEAAEAFVNFLSRPDNAVRNMYFIGYTSSIAADTVYEYMDWTYGVTLDTTDEEYFDETVTSLYEYDLSWFFGEDCEALLVDVSVLELDLTKLDSRQETFTEDYPGNNIVYTVYSGETEINRGRQLFAQYPTQNVIERSAVMLDFGDKLSEINQMWINVRCLDLKDVPTSTYAIVGSIIVLIVAAAVVYGLRYKIFTGYKPKKGFVKVN